MTTDLLRKTHVSVIGHGPDPEILRIENAVDPKILVEGRADLEAALGRLLALDVPLTPKTLDLIAHTTVDKSLLLLGDWLVDATSATVTSFFRGLAENDVLSRLGIHAVRLLGCGSADTAHGRWTVCKLAEILGVEVYGTTGALFASHFDRDGFADARRYQLVASSQLRSAVVDPRELDGGDRDRRTLLVDSLPVVRIERRGTWPIKLADRDDARALLRLIRRDAGVSVPGLRADPSCELAFPATEPGGYYIVQVLGSGELVRVHPAGDANGVVYAVDDPAALMRLVSQLPHA
jgi:hypothetical protein